jgi:hypothetical protein
MVITTDADDRLNEVCNIRPSYACNGSIRPDGSMAGDSRAEGLSRSNVSRRGNTNDGASLQ